LFERHAAISRFCRWLLVHQSHGRSIERLFEEAIMSVLAGWESLSLSKTTLPIRRRPVRRPPGLTAAGPGRLPVAACAPDYGRRRVFALVVIGLLVAATIVALSMLRAAAADDGVPEGITVVEVRSGESLWEVAERVAPGSPPQPVVERIRELNGMQGSTVYPGQPLLVPDGG